MADFNWNNPYPSIRVPLFARNVVATSHPLAAQAGLRMLQKGGNAVDAAIAAAAALIVVEPVSCGLGSDAFAILWDGSQLHGMNASGPAPAAWTPDYFRRHHDGRIPQRGWGSVTVPGMVAGWVDLAERFGKLPFADLFEPAIELAERGHMVAPIVQQKCGRHPAVAGSAGLPARVHAVWPRAASRRTVCFSRSRARADADRRVARRSVLPRRTG